MVFEASVVPLIMSNIPPPSFPVQAPEKASGLAIASLVLGVFSMLGGIVLLFPPILAIVFGHLSQASANREGRKAGLGMSLAGLILGYVSIGLVTVIGLMAAMAIPAFSKVRSASQDKAILNNARQLAAASEQYYLEYGNSAVGFTDLVGGTSYIRMIRPVAGETYPTIYYKNKPIIVLKKDGQTIRYDP